MAYKKYQSDEAKLKVYTRRIGAAEMDTRWHTKANRAIMRYDSKNMPQQQTASGHKLGVPLATSIIDSQYSSLTAVEVDLSVTPSAGGTEDQAYVAGAALSEEWTRCKVNQRAAKAVKDTLLVGIGWVKVGYDYYAEEQEVPRKRDDILADVDRLMGEATERGEEPPTADVLMQMVPLTATEEVALADRIVVDYVPWDMVLWDPTAKNLEDVRWVAQKTLMEPEEVRENPVFREYVGRTRGGLKELDKLKGDSVVSGDDEGGPIVQLSKDDDETDTRVTVYTVYDFETGTVCTFQKGAKYLLNETPNPFAMNDDVEDKSPFVPLILRDTPSRLRGISEMEVLEYVLAEMDLYHSRLGTYLERMAPKVMSKARAFTPAGKRAMKSPEYGEVVELEEGFEPTQDVFALNPPQLMSEMYGMTDKLQVSAMEATGTNELLRGLFPDRKRTATETAEVVSASAARQAEKRLALERFYKGIARRMLQLMQMFYEQERIVRLVDEAGDIDWTFSPDDIVFAYDLDVALTPAEAKSWAARRDNALALLNILGPMAQPGPDGATPVDVTELLRYVLTELNIPRRIVRTILNLPEEQQQQQLAALQEQAAQVQAQAGVPRPDLVPGPLNAEALAAATNQGQLPPEVILAATGNGPGAPEAVEAISEDIGIAGL